MCSLILDSHCSMVVECFVQNVPRISSNLCKFWLFFTKQQNFISVQIESICSDNINLTEKWNFLLRRVEKKLLGKEKRRKCWLPAFSPFPAMFSKAFSFRVVKSPDCVVKIYQTSPGFLRVSSTSLLKTVGKGEIALTEQFLFFSQCFLPVWRIFSSFHLILDCHLQTVSVWKSLKFVVLERVKISENP